MLLLNFLKLICIYYNSKVDIDCLLCRVRLETNCSRNRALEEVARTFFPRETTNV